MTVHSPRQGWAKVRLGDVGRVVSGATPRTDNPAYWDGDIRWATPKDLSGHEEPGITETAKTITSSGLASCSAEVLPVGTVLFSSRAPIGLVAITDVPMATNQGFKSVVPGPGIDPRFLYWTLRHLGPVIAERAPGTTFKEVNKAAMEEVRIPVPPLPDQRRIAALLDKADAIRRKRQQAIRLTEDLLRSAFLDMFGDPVTNPKGWPTRSIGDVADVITGNTPPRERPEYYGDEIEWIKSDNINTPSHILTRAVEGLSEAGRALGRTAPDGSTLMTCIAGSQSCIGNAALTDRTVAFNQQINAIVPRPPVDANFLYVQLLLAKPLIQAASTDSMKGMVSKGRLSSVLLPAPAEERQRAFGRWFSGFLRWRSRLDASSGATGDLFHALTQRAFQGARP